MRWQELVHSLVHLLTNITHHFRKITTDKYMENSIKIMTKFLWCRGEITSKYYPHFHSNVNKKQFFIMIHMYISRDWLKCFEKFCEYKTLMHFQLPAKFTHIIVHAYRFARRQFYVILNSQNWYIEKKIRISPHLSGTPSSKVQISDFNFSFRAWTPEIEAPTVL